MPIINITTNHAITYTNSVFIADLASDPITLTTYMYIDMNN